MWQSAVRLRPFARREMDGGFGFGLVGRGRTSAGLASQRRNKGW
jgi:hypothetical protein